MRRDFSNRLWNCDETPLCTTDTSKKVLARRGSWQVLRLQLVEKVGRSTLQFSVLVWQLELAMINLGSLTSLGKWY